MDYKEHNSEALAYLRDYYLRHRRPMHSSQGDIFENEGVAARLFGYIKSDSFHHMVKTTKEARTLSRPSRPTAAVFATICKSKVSTTSSMN
jgi:hypothetical protein